MGSNSKTYCSTPVQPLAKHFLGREKEVADLWDTLVAPVLRHGLGVDSVGSKTAHKMGIVHGLMGIGKTSLAQRLVLEAFKTRDNGKLIWKRESDDVAVSLGDIRVVQVRNSVVASRS
jgi:hypothetical protein